MEKFNLKKISNYIIDLKYALELITKDGGNA